MKFVDINSLSHFLNNLKNIFEPKGSLDAAKVYTDDSLANLTADDIGVYVQSEEPVNAVEGDIWVDVDAESHLDPEIVIDSTLSISGAAADAKVVGDALNELGMYVTPQMYGAVGDGVTDDTAAFRECVKHGSVYLPKGTYLITETIEVSNPLFMIGNTAVGRWGANGDTCIKSPNGFAFKGVWSNPMTIKNIEFNGYGVDMPCNALFDNCLFNGSGYDEAIGLNNLRVSIVRNCSFKGFNNCGVYKATDSFIENCYIFNNHIGLHMYDSNSNTIRSNKIEWNEVGILYDTAVHNSILSNTFDRNTTYGLKMLNGVYYIIEQNRFLRNLDGHIYLSGSNIVLDGNEFITANTEDDGSGEALPLIPIIINSCNVSTISNNMSNSVRLVDASNGVHSSITRHDNVCNGKSDSRYSINIASNQTFAANETKTLRYMFNNLDYYGTNGWNINVLDCYAINSTSSTVYNISNWYRHPNNGIYATFQNPSDSEQTFTIKANIRLTGMY